MQNENVNYDSKHSCNDNQYNIDAKIVKVRFVWDSINTCGISIIEDRAGNKTYKANNHVQFKDFKTYGGAERWLQRQGYQKATKSKNLSKK